MEARNATGVAVIPIGPSNTCVWCPTTDPRRGGLQVSMWFCSTECERFFYLHQRYIDSIELLEVSFVWPNRMEAMVLTSAPRVGDGPMLDAIGFWPMEPV